MYKMKQEMVKDRMTQEVVTITPGMTVPEAHSLMTKRQVRHLPVIENGNLVGIVTLGDIREAEPSDATSLNKWEVKYLISKLKVEQIMTRNPITVSKYASIRLAARLLQEKKIGGLPVVDQEGTMAGILTEDDILRMVIEEWGPKTTEASLETVAA